MGDFENVRKTGVLSVILGKERKTVVFDAIMKTVDKSEIVPGFRKKLFFSGFVLKWSGSCEIVSGVDRVKFVIFTFFVAECFFFSPSLFVVLSIS